MENYQNAGKLSIIFMADLKKTFHTVRLESVYKCLDFFNFIEYLIKWVEVMYNNMSKIK